VFFKYFGIVGIAVATTLAGWVNVGMLVAGLRGSLGLGPQRRAQLIRTALAAAVMGAVVWLASVAMESWFHGDQWQRIVALLLLVGVGFSAYALLALVLKATSIAELRQGFRR
jgi:putative peptidoglycan lipid II flippase